MNETHKSEDELLFEIEKLKKEIAVLKSISDNKDAAQSRTDLERQVIYDIT